MNPIDWGNSPMQVALVRGVIAALLSGGGVGISAYLNAETPERAILLGIGAMIASLLALLGFGASDANRADKGIVIAGDVPVQSVAKIEDKKATTVAKEVRRDVQAKL